MTVPILVHTRLWGSLSLKLTLRTVSEAGRTDIDWQRSMIFPGLEPGQKLRRRISLPRRATLLARDGSVLAESPPEGQSGRSAPLGELVERRARQRRADSRIPSPGA